METHAAENHDGREDEGPAKNVDQEAVSKAMKNLAGEKKAEQKKDVKKVKVDPADVTLLVRCSAALLRGRAAVSCGLTERA